MDILLLAPCSYFIFRLTVSIYLQLNKKKLFFIAFKQPFRYVKPWLQAGKPLYCFLMSYNALNETTYFDSPSTFCACEDLLFFILKLFWISSNPWNFFAFNIEISTHVVLSERQSEIEMHARHKPLKNKMPFWLGVFRNISTIQKIGVKLLL